MKAVKTIALALAALTAASLTSCRHKYLYMEEPMSSALEVVFDWREAPEADPASMAMYLYDNDGTSPIRYIFDNRKGGEIKAPFGTRHAICINADNTSWARLRKSENISSLEISTPDADDFSARSASTSSLPRAEGTENERLATTPYMLWGSRMNNIAIVPHTGTDTITLYPHEAVCHYMVDIYDVDNLDGVQSGSVDATLSGMAEGYCFGNDKGTDTPVTMVTSLKANASEDNLHGEFLTFGECATTTAQHYLTVYMILKDGSKWWHSFDVTDQVTDAPDPHHVHIIVRGLPLPEPPSGEGTSLRPDVNEWQPVNIGLQM